MAARTLVSRLSPFLAASRFFSPRLRPIILAAGGLQCQSASASVSIGGLRSFSSRPTTSSLNDPSPNWSNRPPKETILLDGCDFEHWLVVMEPPDPNLTRDDIIDSYIKTLAEVVGSEQEARMKIYSVSTKHYFAFGALVSEELSYKIKALPRVRWVLPDSYLDVKNKDYGGEPFINGEAVPYDPKYHEEWVRNNARANERSRRNDRPRNFDRSRNFERRRETMQNRDAPPMPNQSFQSGPNQPPPPQNAAPPMPNQTFQSGPNQPPPQYAAPAGSPPPPNRNFNAMPNSSVPPSQPPPNIGYQNQMPNPGYQGGGPSYQGQGGGPSYQGQGGGPAAYQGSGYQGGNPGYQGGNPGYQGGNPGYQGGSPGYQGPGYQSAVPPYQTGNNYQAGNTYQGGSSPNYQSPAHQGGSPPNYQSPAQQGGNPGNYQGGTPGYQGRDVPGRDQE